MRFLGLALLALPACSPSPEPAPKPPQAAVTTPRGLEVQRLTADTPTTTAAGHSFTAPAGWSVSVRGRATIVTAPEGDSDMVFVDVLAKNAAMAVEVAWAEYGRTEIPALQRVERFADKDGWTDIRRFRYEVPPSKGRFLVAEASRTKDAWLVVLVDMSNAVAEKRQAELLLMFEGRRPNGYTRESFAGKTANRLDGARVAALTQFVEMAQAQLGVPGVSLGIVQDGEVVFLGGFGVRELGKPAKVDGDTKFMIGSQTKALTTLMLAKLVDERRIEWDSFARTLLPSFALGDAETTAKVQVKHLVCACTGLPRQDYEFSFEFGNVTPQQMMDVLATMQPTSEFGELYQYSNVLAAAAGYVGGHVVYPKLELGEAYDRAMRSRVFVPLQMKDTTLDHGHAQRGNWARPHAPDVDGRVAPAVHALNAAVVPIRPAGGAWSTARDILAYVQMELAEGSLPSGDRYINKDTLLARRVPQVASGDEATYGMGLEVRTQYGVTVVHHGGSSWGYHSDMMWLPEHGVGAVILTNGDPGWTIRDAFTRKLLEVLFDGTPQADAEVTTAAAILRERMSATRQRLDLPVDPAVAAGLALTYENAALGELTVARAGEELVFDFGEWSSAVASRKNLDGTTSLVTISPGITPNADGFEFLVGAAAGRRTLTVFDNQHDYVFVER